jgi:hypothetical protein
MMKKLGLPSRLISMGNNHGNVHRIVYFDKDQG